MNKKVLVVAISSALVAPMAAQAVEFKLSGHVNRMIRFADDGQGSDIQQIDNTASRTRFRFVGSGDVGNGMKAGVRFEAGIASNRSGIIAPKESDGGDSAGDIRHSAIWFSGDFGKVTMGHTSQASDGASFADLSGTGLADEAAVFEHCSSCSIRTSGGGTVGSISNFMSSFDGGRIDVLRYDSPALGPATVAASVGNNQEWDIGVYIDHSVGGGSLSLYGGYRNSTNRRGNEQWSVSGAFLFSQGTSIQATYGERDPIANPTDADNFYVKLGHKWGANAVSISYGVTSDLGGAEDATAWGVGWVHTIKKPGIDVYAGYHNFDVDITGVDTEDLDVFVVGSRIKFQ